MTEGTPQAKVAPWEIPWTFTVTWDPECGALPWPILRLFRGRSTIEPGRALKETDQGHSTYYERSVKSYVGKYHPTRDDIVASAEIAAAPTT